MNNVDNLSISNPVNCDPEQCLNYLKEPNYYLKILQQNIRSLNCNFDELRILLSRFSFDTDIIVLSECWLSLVSNVPVLPGYKSYKSNDCYNQNDGVVIYLKDHLACRVEEPSFMEANCLIVKLGNDTAIVAFYRPPCFKVLENFIISLGNILESLSSYKNVVIVGDTNIDLLKNDANTSKYLDTLSYFGLLPVIDSTTRGKACLDHVIIKTRTNSFTFNLPTTVTDHAALLYCLQNLSLNNRPITSTVSKINLHNIKAECSKLDFDIIFKENNLNIALNTFINYMSQIIKNSSLIIVPRRKVIIKPWITKGLLRCIRNRDRMHTKVKLNPNNDILAISYRRYRNFCNNLLKKLKRQYEKDQLLRVRNDSKKLWDSIRKVTNSNTQKTIPSELLLSESTPKIAVNRINEFFVTVGENLAAGIATSPPKLNTTTDGPVHSFVLLPCDCEEVERTISHLKNDCSPGWDGISAKILKTVSHIITPVLTDIINRCLTNGVFPDALKKSIVHPIFKGGDRGRVNNYRPISILSTLSKIFERIINNRLTKYLEQKNLLAKNQYGFRTGKSTDDAIHDFTDFITKKIDQKQKCLTIFLDLAKAFDTVSVPHLVRKLHRLGIRGTQLSLFSDYLRNRSQCVRVGDHYSDYLPIKYGVPQGSIIGPTLFLCFINDICQLKINNCRIASYADDTTLTFYADSWEELHSLAQSGFDIINKWLTNNCLTLNTDKTKYIVFTINNAALPLSLPLKSHRCQNPTTAICDCPVITSTQDIKYLGVILDNNLRFNLHIHMVAKRIRKLIYIFKQLRHVADGSLMRMVYQTLAQSIISYCITSWGGATKTLMLELERAQRVLLKVCFFKPRRFPTVQLYSEADVLSVRQIFILHTVLRQHSNITIDNLNTVSTDRRFYTVCKPNVVHTSFAYRFYHFRSGRLYNSINKKLNIAKFCKNECKNKIIKWLKQQNYEKTEKLLEIII